MKEINYTPEKMPEGFEGTIKIKVPLARDRLKFLKEVNFKMNEAGEMDISIDDAEKISKMIEIASQYVIDCSIKHIESGTEFKTFEDLESDSDLTNLCIEIGAKILGGFSLSKNLKPL